MQIQVNTDNHIEGSAGFTSNVEAVVEGALGRFRSRITRVEVHLTDENSSQKSTGQDMKCVMEARLAGLQPLTVTGQGATVEQALDSAAEKLKTSIERTLGRLDDHKGRTSHAGDPAA